jgi:CheY-like chemotaxis protein
MNNMNREKRTILLINHGDDLFFLKMLLDRLAYRVETAPNAGDALRMMEENIPDIVLSESVLPDMSGSDLVKRMRKSGRLGIVPVVLLSPKNDPVTQEFWKQDGFAACLVKPVEPDLLYRTIQAVTEAVPRKYARLKASLPVIIGDGTAMGGAERTERATAISEGGMYVRTLYPQPRNTLTPVRIMLPGREIAAKAVVLYNCAKDDGPYQEPGMGMKFVEISDADRAAIKSYIRDRLMDISVK